MDGVSMVYVWCVDGKGYRIDVVWMAYEWCVDGEWMECGVAGVWMEHGWCGWCVDGN